MRHTSAMPNIAVALKQEIARVARKEPRDETTRLKKAVNAHRSDITELKRAVKSLEQEVKRLARLLRKPAAASPEDGSGAGLRFSAKGLRAQRGRLGLSAEDRGLLVGASGQSVDNWEAGKTRPRDARLAAIGALRTLGKREVADRLAALR